MIVTLAFVLSFGLFMFIVDVIPATKIPLGKSQVYTYYSAHKISVGALVMVEFYRRKILGIVINIQELEKRKIEVKRYPYQLKEILKVIDSKPVLTSVQLKLASWIAEYYWAPLSLTIKSMLPEIPSKKAKKKYPSIIKAILESTDYFPLERSQGYVKTNSKIEKLVQSIEKSKKKNFLLFNSKEGEKEKIYLELLKKFLKKDKQILILFPEISNLKKIVLKIKSFLDKSEAAILFSGLPKTLYWQEWQKIRNGDVKIIFGTRIALFAPFQKLELIVVDDEQNQSYKSDQAPRYQTKKTALKLAELAKTKIILESSTPSVESYWASKQKKYKLIIQNSKSKIQNFVIVDMKEESHKGNYSIFSEVLVDSLKRTLKQKKQVVLFVGRRGMATFIICQDCGYVVKCPNCNIPLVYHILEKNEILTCHHCNYNEAPPPFCPKCSSHRIKYSGIGTQKVEAEIKKLFPKAKVRRLDSDIAKSKKQENKIWQDFTAKKIDILIGTQMILKAQDFKNVDLIGVVSIDSILNIPDFRSGERVFQTITKFLKLPKLNKAKIILQTYHPNNLIFRVALRGDYEDFYKNEIKDRRALTYPPFSNLIRLIYKNKDRKLCEENSKILAERLKNRIYNIQYTKYKIQVLGPAPAFIPKERGRYIWQIVIKIRNESEKIENKLKNELLKIVPNDWTVDVDPESLL